MHLAGWVALGCQSRGLAPCYLGSSELSWALSGLCHMLSKGKEEMLSRNLVL